MTVGQVICKRMNYFTNGNHFTITVQRLNIAQEWELKIISQYFSKYHRRWCRLWLQKKSDSVKPFYHLLDLAKAYRNIASAIPCCSTLALMKLTKVVGFVTSFLFFVFLKRVRVPELDPLGNNGSGSTFFQLGKRQKCAALMNTCQNGRVYYGKMFLISSVFCRCFCFLTNWSQIQQPLYYTAVLRIALPRFPVPSFSWAPLFCMG